jgi:hypothetical protein
MANPSDSLLYYQPGSIAYTRAYGWGWLALLGVMAVVVGGVDPSIRGSTNWALQSDLRANYASRLQ